MKPDPPVLNRACRQTLMPLTESPPVVQSKYAVVPRFTWP
jgi:hypothetical protein